MGYLRCGKQTSLVKDGLPHFSDLCTLSQPVLGIKRLQSCLVCAFLKCPTRWLWHLVAQPVPLCCDISGCFGLSGSTSWSMDSQRSQHHTVGWFGKQRQAHGALLGWKMQKQCGSVCGRKDGIGRGDIGGQGSYRLAELPPLLFWYWFSSWKNKPEHKWVCCPSCPVRTGELLSLECAAVQQHRGWAGREAGNTSLGFRLRNGWDWDMHFPVFLSFMLRTSASQSKGSVQLLSFYTVFCKYLQSLACGGVWCVCSFGIQPWASPKVPLLTSDQATFLPVEA